MKQLKQLFSLGKREAVIGGSLLMTSGLSMAAEGDIDTTKALAYIAGGPDCGGGCDRCHVRPGGPDRCRQESQRAGT
ncbi:hypothetical protein [Pseudomonas aeruginosa]|uniref:hypothetical protein n=1 Tax=Pseudomonas aeruginosa TaxID=287 RepID=UPI001BAFF525|nr:hypothetical protein [Pseudomonas aeruginosa]QUS27447.1 hypothetical protein IFJ78_10930 [Pseudomonas aeruginosa]